MSKFIFGNEMAIKPKLISGVKLLVYETPLDQELIRHEYRCRRKLKEKVKKAKIGSLWINKNEQNKIDLAGIWEELIKKP